MADIFVSYSSTDRERAKVLAEAIEMQGWSVWWDRKIPLGKSWDQVIEEQVDAARCIIVLWSTDSIASSWVKTEAREGKARGILIPVLIDAVKIPLEFRHMQAADLTAWRAGTPSGEFDVLLAHIAGMLASPPQERKMARAAPAVAVPTVLPGSPSVTSHPREAREEPHAHASAPRGSVEAALAGTLGGPAEVRCIRFLPDGERLLSLWADNRARIWRLGDGKLLETLQGEGHEAWRVAAGASFSRDGTLLATTPDPTTVLLWRVADGKLLHTLNGHTDVINAVAFSPDGSILASASDDKTARQWRTDTGEPAKTLRGHTQWVRSIAFSPDGELIATGAQVFISSPELKLWRRPEGRKLHDLSGHASTIHCLAFSSDGTVLASGAGDNSVRTWGTSKGQLRHKLEKHGGTVSCIAFSPDGGLLASGSHDNSIRIWSSENGNHLQHLQGHGAAVTCVEFSPDGTVLASGSPDHTVRLWSLKSEIRKQPRRGRRSSRTAAGDSIDTV